MTLQQQGLSSAVYDENSITARISSLSRLIPADDEYPSGACITLGPDDLDEAMIAAADWVYLEGYLFDSPQGPALFDRAAAIARDNGSKLAVTVSDPWCVERHHAALSAFVANNADLVFGNADEIKALAGTDLDQASP